MPTFVIFGKMTDQGAQNVKNLPDAVEKNIERGKAMGITLREWFLTQGGEYDVVVVADAPDAETMLTQTFGIVGTGNVRTTTARAYSLDEVRQAAQKLG